MEGLVKKSLFPRRSDTRARREVREPEKIKVEDYEREGESPGGYSLIKAMYVCAAPKGNVFAPFWSENGYRLPLFWSGRVLVFAGTKECMNVFILSIPNEKKEREICEFEMDFKKSFLCLF